MDLKNEAVSSFTVRDTVELDSVNSGCVDRHTSTGLSNARKVEVPTVHANRRVGHKEGRLD